MSENYYTVLFVMFGVFGGLLTLTSIVLMCNLIDTLLELQKAIRHWRHINKDSL